MDNDLISRGEMWKSLVSESQGQDIQFGYISTALILICLWSRIHSEVMVVGLFALAMSIVMCLYNRKQSLRSMEFVLQIEWKEDALAKARYIDKWNKIRHSIYLWLFAIGIFFIIGGFMLTENGGLA